MARTAKITSNRRKDLSLLKFLLNFGLNSLVKFDIPQQSIFRL